MGFSSRLCRFCSVGYGVVCCLKLLTAKENATVGPLMRCVAPQGERKYFLENLESVFESNFRHPKEPLPLEKESQVEMLRKPVTFARHFLLFDFVPLKFWGLFD